MQHKLVHTGSDLLWTDRVNQQQEELVTSEITDGDQVFQELPADQPRHFEEAVWTVFVMVVFSKTADPFSNSVVFVLLIFLHKRHLSCWHCAIGVKAGSHFTLLHTAIHISKLVALNSVLCFQFASYIQQNCTCLRGCSLGPGPNWREAL